MAALRKLEKAAIKATKKELDVRFWERCVDLQLCPEFLKFKPPKIKQYEKVHRWYHSVVKESLEVAKLELKREKSKLQVLQQNVYTKISSEQKDELSRLMELHCDKYKIGIIAGHDAKLLNLWIRQRPRSPECITNLSDKKLSVEERRVLYIGLNHHILPKRVDVHEVKVAVEKICNPVKSVASTMKDNVTQPTILLSRFKDEIKAVTRNFLNAAKHICSTKANQNFHKTLQQLSKDSDIAVVKYDKGNGVCILPRDEYLRKLDQIVGDTSKFMEKTNTRKNARHPLYRRQEIVRDEVKAHLQKHLTANQLFRLQPSGCAVGKLYGTCKVHKKDHPIRPIVSMVNTPEYELAKYLDRIIKPYLPSAHSITSNEEFLGKLRQMEHQKEDYCISFDIVSLFTNVPLTETIHMIANDLYDPTQTNKPPMKKSGLIELLKLATGGMFSHRGRIYQQRDGVAMGNPLAPTMANFLLGKLEEKLFDPTIVNGDYPAFYTRYVDDIFCVFRKSSDYEKFLSKLNSLHENLQFTYELGGDRMPFLDTEVKLSSNGLESTIFRKKTNTDVVLNHTAIAPTKWKTGLIKCFLHRADVVCSNEKLRKEEINKLRNICTRNGYSTQFFEKAKTEFENKKKKRMENLQNQSTNENENTKKDEKLPISIFKIPYVGKTSEFFGRRIKKLMKMQEKEIRVVYQTTKVSESFQLKDPIPKELQAKVVYEFTCRGDPDVSYIGKTDRTLKERYREHVRGGTAISDHITVCQECDKKGVTLNDFKVLKRCRYKTDTPKFEAVLIKEKDPKLNRQLVKPGGKQYTLVVFD